MPRSRHAYHLCGPVPDGMQVPHLPRYMLAQTEVRLALAAHTPISCKDPTMPTVRIRGTDTHAHNMSLNRILHDG